MKKLFLLVAMAAFVFACNNAPKQEEGATAEAAKTECCSKKAADETKCCKADSTAACCKKTGEEGKCCKEGKECKKDATQEVKKEETPAPAK